jgi:hypothetical protein
MPTACFFIFCFFAPAPSVPDGQGGYVPFNNSRVMPDGSLRPYDPAFDGAPPPAPYGYDFYAPYAYGPPPPPPGSYGGYGLEYGPSGVPPYMAPRR